MATPEKFKVPQGWVLQAYQFALDPTASQLAALESHAGGARFAYNTMLAAVKANLDQRAAERSYGIAEQDLTPSMSWSFQSLRNAFNVCKHSAAVRSDGSPWWAENSKEVYAGACRNLSAGLSNWSKSKKGERKGPRTGFPRFKSKHRAAKAFTFTTGAIRVEPSRHHITLPTLGTLHVHESTRQLARRIEAGSARILKATVGFKRGRWQVAFTVLVARTPTPPAHVKTGVPVIGIDAGVRDLIVAAALDGTEILRCKAPRELRRATRTLKALQRKAARQHGRWDPAAKVKQEPSNGWLNTQHKIATQHARVANLRGDRMHKLTTALAQQHTIIGTETLAVKNMMAAGGSRKRGLNRSIADAGLGEMFRQLDYKTTRYGSTVVKADRWFPSSKLCSGCGAVKTKLHLSERIYRCEHCGAALDRDLNAAINLARYALNETEQSACFDTGGADCKTHASAALVAAKPEPRKRSASPSQQQGEAA